MPEFESNNDEFDDIEDDDEFDKEILETDFGFILDSEGNLKSIFLPKDGDIPKKIFEILKICGIENSEEIYGRDTPTMH